MSDASKLKTRAWLLELMERSLSEAIDVDLRPNAFLEGDEELRIEELGLDSLALMQLSIDVEDEVGVQLSIEHLSQAKTLGQLLEMINKSIMDQDQ